MMVAARSVAVSILLMLSACAAPPAPPSPASERAVPAATAAGMARTGAMLSGRARADVEAALGPATRIRFDSGYEVWVYRFVDTTLPPAAHRPAPARGARGAFADDDALSELVLLLTPSGTVARVRVRTPSPDARGRSGP